MAKKEAVKVLLTVPEVVREYPGVKEWTLREWIRNGVIRSIRNGRRILIPREAVDDLLAGRAVKDGSACSNESTVGGAVTCAASLGSPTGLDGGW